MSEDWIKVAAENHTLPPEMLAKPYHNPEWLESRTKYHGVYGDDQDPDAMHMPIFVTPEGRSWVGGPGQSHVYEEQVREGEDALGLKDYDWDERRNMQGGINVVGNQYQVHLPEGTGHLLTNEEAQKMHAQALSYIEDVREGEWHAMHRHLMNGENEYDHTDRSRKEFVPGVPVPGYRMLVDHPQLGPHVVPVVAQPHRDFYDQHHLDSGWPVAQQGSGTWERQVPVESYSHAYIAPDNTVFDHRPNVPYHWDSPEYWQAHKEGNERLNQLAQQFIQPQRTAAWDDDFDIEVGSDSGPTTYKWIYWYPSGELHFENVSDIERHHDDMAADRYGDGPAHMYDNYAKGYADVWPDAHGKPQLQYQWYNTKTTGPDGEKRTVPDSVKAQVLDRLQQLHPETQAGQEGVYQPPGGRSGAFQPESDLPAHLGGKSAHRGLQSLAADDEGWDLYTDAPDGVEAYELENRVPWYIDASDLKSPNPLMWIGKAGELHMDQHQWKALPGTPQLASTIKGEINLETEPPTYHVYSYHHADKHDWAKNHIQRAFTQSEHRPEKVAGTPSDWKEKYNYKLKTKGGNSCAGCSAWKIGANAEGNGLGRCEMFKATVKSNYTCDEWSDTWTKESSSDLLADSADNWFGPQSVDKFKVEVPGDSPGMGGSGYNVGENNGLMKFRSPCWCDVGPTDPHEWGPTCENGLHPTLPDYTAGANGDLPEDLQIKPVTPEKSVEEEYLVAYSGGKEIGVIEIYNGRIMQVSVLPEYQRRGVAKALYEAAQNEWGDALHHGTLTDDGVSWVEGIEPGMHEFEDDGNGYWEPKYKTSAEQVPGNEGHWESPSPINENGVDSSPNRTNNWVWLDGHVEFGGDHHNILESLARAKGYPEDQIKYMSNMLARGQIPDDKAIAFGEIKQNYPYLHASTRDRNAVWDDVQRAHQGTSDDAEPYASNYAPYSGIVSAPISKVAASIDGMQITHSRLNLPSGPTEWVSATDPQGTVMGKMMLRASDGLILDITVPAQYRRSGVATAMFNYAQQQGLNPQHSTMQSEMAQQWAPTTSPQPQQSPQLAMPGALAKTGMAFSPQKWQSLIAIGEPFYHVTHEMFIDDIMANGLTPASELGNQRDQGYWTPRKGHVYLFTNLDQAFESGRYQDDAWGSDPLGFQDPWEHMPNQPVVLQVDIKQLDPNLFKADEDFLHNMTYTPGFEVLDGDEWRAPTAQGYGYGTPPHMPGMHGGTGQGLGDWAHEQKLDSPAITDDSADYHMTVAYEGRIPPSALSILKQ